MMSDGWQHQDMLLHQQWLLEREIEMINFELQEAAAKQREQIAVDLFTVSRDNGLVAIEKGKDDV